MSEFSLRIASRSDTLENWTTNNPLLQQGEIAIVFDNGNQMFKVGDGEHTFNDLPFSFYDQFASEQINTSYLKAKNIIQGFGSGISGIGGVASGYKSQVSANFAQAHGYQATVSSDIGYVWNGDRTATSYADHGQGTYNLNPTDGISGFYIGNQNLKEIINSEAPAPDLSEYTPISVFNRLSAEVDPPSASITPASNFYTISADRMNDLGTLTASAQLTSEVKVILANYDFSKSYVMKFTTPANNEVKFKFYKNNSSTYDASMNINTNYTFPMNSGFVAEIKFDAMDIRPLKWNGERQKMTFRTIEWVED